MSPSERRLLEQALKLAMGGCGSALHVVNNRHNFTSSFPGGMGFFDSMGEDAQRGYDAAVKALATLQDIGGEG